MGAAPVECVKAADAIVVAIGTVAYAATHGDLAEVFAVRVAVR